MKEINGRPLLDLRVDITLDTGIEGPEGAEISALLFLLDHCILPITAWSDCQNVIDSFDNGRLHCTSPEHPQCRLWRLVWAKLDDHGEPGLLTLRKVKAHTNARNYAAHGMTYTQWLGNRYADKGANSTALLMAEELNLKGWIDECDEIEADHRGLCKWIAFITAYTNRPEHRDAIPVPAGLIRKGRYKNPSTEFRPSGRKRVKAQPQSAVARMMGTEAEGTFIISEAECKYPRLEEGLVTARRLIAKTSPSAARLQGHLDAEDWPAAEDGYESEASGSQHIEDWLEEVMGDTIPPAAPIGNAGHGGLLLQTGDIIWCVRCGASAKIGFTSKYLRDVCGTKPKNASMRQRRNRLVRCCHPTTSKPLNATARRVAIV